MINTVAGVRDPVAFEVVKGEREDGDEVMWVDAKNGEGVMGIGDVRVPDALREFHDHELADGILDFDALRDAIVVDREFSVRDRGDSDRWRCQAENEGSRGGGVGARGGGGDVVHDVLRGGVKVEASNFEGHKVAGRLERGESSATLYLCSIGNDQGGSVTSSENNGQDDRDRSKC